MADGFVQVPPDSTGQRVDASSLSVAGVTVVRQRIVIADDSNASNFAAVSAGSLLVARPGYAPAIMSASHGPKCVTASASANVTLIASPGAGASIHITQIMVGNNSNTLTLSRVGTSASIATIVQPLAAAGGGYVFKFDPPWKLSASEAAVCSVKPNASDVYFTVNFFVA